MALLAQLLSVIEHLDDRWTLAFLKRTRFLDSEFLADLLASISASRAADQARHHVADARAQQ